MAHGALAVSMLMTPDEFLDYPVPDGRAELVRGEVRVSPFAGGPHGRVATNLVVMLSIHVKSQQLGDVFGDGSGYELTQLPRTVRCPDVSFVRAGKLPVEGIEPGFLKLVPDLAVEVLSPREKASELEEKIRDYLACGTELIWVVDPVRRTVMIVSSNAPLHWLGETDTLNGGAVIPGFDCNVAELFEGIARLGQRRTSR